MSSLMANWAVVVAISCTSTNASWAFEPCHKGVPRITLVQGEGARYPGTMDPDTQSIAPDGKVTQGWHNLKAALRPLKVICHYSDQDVTVVLADTTNSCTFEWRGKTLPRLACQ